MILENAVPGHRARPASSWWKTLPGRLLALLRKGFAWLNAPEPNVTLHEQMKEYHQTKYMHLIHKM
jgi:hypothetical protein